MVQKYPPHIFLPKLCPLKLPHSSRCVCCSLPSHRPLLQWHKSVITVICHILSFCDPVSCKFVKKFLVQYNFFNQATMGPVGCQTVSNWAMGWMIWGSDPSSSKTLLPKSPYQLHLPILLLRKWHWWLFPRGIKRLRHEIHRSPPSSAKVKNEWRYTSIPSICLHGMYSNFTFFLIVSSNSCPT